MCDCDLTAKPPVCCEPHQALLEQATDAFRLGLIEGQTRRMIDAMQMSALAMGKILDLSAEDIPRLLISASCRGLERLIEFYERHKGTASLTDQAKMRAQIYDTADAMRNALREGLETTESILSSLEVKESPRD